VKCLFGRKLLFVVELKKRGGKRRAETTLDILMCATDAAAVG
jgi:hypothetical protein